MKKSKKIVKINKLNIKRLRVMEVLLFLIFVLLIIRLAYLQFVEGNELSTQASSRQTSTQTITPTRGIIYDTNGKVLAISAEVDTVSVNPSRLKYNNGDSVPFEFAAQSFSNIFGLEYSEVLEKLNSEKSTVNIASKVENDKIELLRDWMKSNKINSGINIDSATKRYYPYNNLACHMIGFTGTDGNRFIWFGKFP